MNKINELSSPATILIASIVLGGFYYASEISKQSSIEKQRAEDNKRQELLLKQKECESLSAGVMKKWNNVMGVTYSDNIFNKGCIVTYTDSKTGEVKTALLKDMQTEK